MFLDLDLKPNSKLAIVDNIGQKITYGELVSFADEFYEAVSKRTLMFVLCENSAGALAGYVAGMQKKIVPLLISCNMERGFLDELMGVYHPEYLWVPSQIKNDFSFKIVYERYNYALLKTELEPYEMNDELSLLLTTSGSTGSAKFVRHCYRNVVCNAENVAKAFGLTENHRGMVSLPLQFTQGLNTATSHLLVGATAYLSTDNLMQKSYWEFIKENKVTSFTGVPYSYEVMNRLGFFEMELPDLRIINEGGGRLPDKLFMKCVTYAQKNGKKFIATYGSTETTSRMAFLPPEWALQKCGSIGKALPGCELLLLNDVGDPIEQAGEVGEVVFKGPNVTMGYAESGKDLIKGDERHGVYYTGDLATRDEDGCFFIVGRKKRFVKIFGYRISLDEVERLIKDEFKIECACIGTDKRLIIFVCDEEKKTAICEYLSQKMNLHISVFCVRVIDEIPKNETGKNQYAILEKL